MNRNQIILIPRILLLVCGGLLWSAPSRLLADADDKPAPEEHVVTKVSVQIGKIRTETLHRFINGYGTVETAPATTEQPAAGAQLAAPSAGVVARVNVIEGQRVEKGDLVLELNSSTMTAENAAQELARQKQLYAQQNTSLKNLQMAAVQLALLRVTAPLSGTVVRVNVKPGQAVDSTTIVAEIMDLARLAVSAEIPAEEAGELKCSNVVEVSSVPPVTTELSFVSPVVNKNNDTVLVRALLPAGGTLRPGQFVPMRIVTAVHTNSLAAPTTAVVTDVNGKSTIALVKGDEAEQLAVQTGLRENGWIEVAAPGLKPGDTIVTVGAYGLPEKTKIRIQNISGEATSPNAASAQ